MNKEYLTILISFIGAALLLYTYFRRRYCPECGQILSRILKGSEFDSGLDFRHEYWCANCRRTYRFWEAFKKKFSK